MPEPPVVLLTSNCSNEVAGGGPMRYERTKLMSPFATSTSQFAVPPPMPLTRPWEPYCQNAQLPFQTPVLGLPVGTAGSTELEPHCATSKSWLVTVELTSLPAALAPM